MEWEEQVHADGQVVTIRLKGEIDLQHSPRLREVLRARAAARTPALLLDFSEVKYIDSSGLATLVEYYQQSREFSGKIAIIAATDRVQSVFNLVRLNEIFQFFSTVEEARSSLG